MTVRQLTVQSSVVPSGGSVLLNVVLEVLVVEEAITVE